VPDMRNTRVGDVIRELLDYEIAVDAYDPRALPGEVEHELALRMVDDPFRERDDAGYDAVILAVPHDEFRSRTVREFVDLLRTDRGRAILIDIRGMLSREAVEAQGVDYWRL
jgi:UDP-N-acetyl-D-galactosamine dehydrogenase